MSEADIRTAKTFSGSSAETTCPLPNQKEKPGCTKSWKASRRPGQLSCGLEIGTTRAWRLMKRHLRTQWTSTQCTRRGWEGIPGRLMTRHGEPMSIRHDARRI